MSGLYNRLRDKEGPGTEAAPAPPGNIRTMFQPPAVAPHPAPAAPAGAAGAAAPGPGAPEGMAAHPGMAARAGTPVRPVLASSPAGDSALRPAGLAGSAPSLHVARPQIPAALRTHVQSRLADDLESGALAGHGQDPRSQEQALVARIAAVLEEEGSIRPLDREAAARALYDDLMGMGPLQALLDDDEVSEIMVNGPHHVYVERHGRLQRVDAGFHGDGNVMQLIERIVSPLGRRIDESSPMVDARLPDGSRVNAIIPPLALKGPTLTIRKFAKKPITVADLVRFGTLTAAMATFLAACVEARLNVIVSGGTGSGKTTTLNVLSSFIPAEERIVTIEDAAELQLRQDHVVTLETRPPNIEGRGEVSIRNLVKNALRMRPDRIVVGECRGGEALDMLQAMNTGHDGSLTTAHANSPRDVISRLETMVLMAGMDLPLRAIREQIGAALDLVVQCSRLRDGTRRITHITEVQGLEGDVVVLQDIFTFVQEGIDTAGRVIGQHQPTGLRPHFMDRLETAGCDLPAEVFGGSRF